MPSFKAFVTEIGSEGGLSVTVDPASCIPANLGCNIASVNVAEGVPSGIYVTPQALTHFPPEALDIFSPGEWIRISWRAEGNLMTNLKIRHTS